MTRWRPTKKSEAIALALLAFCGFLLLLIAIFSVPGPARKPFNWGFGPQWHCNAEGIVLRQMRPPPVARPFDFRTWQPKRANVEVVWLTGRLIPDQKTIGDLRKDSGWHRK